MQDGHLSFHGRTCHTGFGTGSVRHQTIIEEIPQVPILAERPCTQVFQVVDVDITIQVAVGKVRRQQQQVLLLGDLVCLFLMRGFGILLQISIILGLEPCADIYLISVIYRGAHPRRDVTPFRMPFFQ